MELKLFHGEQATTYTVWVEFEPACPSVGYRDIGIEEIVFLNVNGSTDKKALNEFQEKLDDSDWKYIKEQAYKKLESPVYLSD